MFSSILGRPSVTCRADVVGDGTLLALLSSRFGSEVRLHAPKPNRRLQVTDLASRGNGDSYRVPTSPRVFRPSIQEVEQIFRGEFVGRFRGAYASLWNDFADKLDPTYSAIEVIDVTPRSNIPVIEGRQIWYQPAPLQHPDIKKPEGADCFFVFMEEGDMPSYFFWQSRDARPRIRRSTAPSPESFIIEPFIRSRSSTPEPSGPTVPFVPGGPSKSRKHISKKPTPSRINTNTDEADAVVVELTKENEQKKEKHSLSMLDKYNEKSFGRPCIRMRREWPSEFVEREFFETPCLPPIDLTKIPPPTTALPKEAPAIEEISDNDEAFVHFKKKLERREQIRKARMHPKPQYDSDCCNQIGEKNTLKRSVTTDDFEALIHRVLRSETLIAMRHSEEDSKCPICDELYTSIGETIPQHHARHQAVYCATRPFAPPHPHATPARNVKASGVPTLAEFRQLEKRALLAENEILEREEVCPACGTSLQFQSNSAETHYAEHRVEYGEYMADLEASCQEFAKETISQEEIDGIADQMQSWVGSPKIVIVSAILSIIATRQSQERSAHDSPVEERAPSVMQHGGPQVDKYTDMLLTPAEAGVPMPVYTSVHAYRLLTPSTSNSTSPTSSRQSKRSLRFEAKVAPVATSSKKRMRDEVNSTLSSRSSHRQPKPACDSATESVSEPEPTPVLARKKPGRPLSRAQRRHYKLAKQAGLDYTQPRSTRSAPVIPDTRIERRRPSNINTKAAAAHKRSQSQPVKTLPPPLSPNPSPKIPSAPRKKRDTTYKPDDLPSPDSSTPLSKKPAKKPAATSSEGSERILRGRVVKPTSPAKKTGKGKGKK